LFRRRARRRECGARDQGALWDVIVDLRRVANYLKWFWAELADDNRSMLYIPRGFGHGFITLRHPSPDTWFR
jgi:dTDP-4-dehydrorhamnose 3,5-epimerase-like enzyme